MADRYKIYEKLGAGGVGAVFRAYDSQLKRWVAVKRLLSANEAEQDKGIETELKREADTLASLRNPNVVTIFDVASDAEGLFIVMELLQGEDLADVVARGPLPYDDFKELASQTLEGLLAAHQHHILHRDIKPENIKVERLPGGRLQSKIIDFGLARAGLRARKQTEDQAGTVMGSIFYMAPEQLTREPVDERTDLYSLGCVFYEALSGKKAFDGDSMSAVIDKHINHDMIPLHVIAPHVPAWLGAWCARLMAQRPEDRPTGAQQAIEEFRAWEKVPTMVPYMPWMGMYPAYAPVQSSMTQPMYMMPGTGAVPVPGTGSVPVGSGYFPVMEQQPAMPVYAEPVALEVVLEPHQIVEMAAITKPVGSGPVRPRNRTGAIAPQRPAAQVSAQAKQPKNVKKMAMIAGGVLALVTAIILFTRGGSKKTDGSNAGNGGLLSAITDSGPQKVRFQLPQERVFPPADRNISVFFVGNTGALSSRKGGDGKLANANTNEALLEWHDLAERGADNILRAHQGNTAYGPKLVDWPTSKTGGGPKGGLKALDFNARDGKPTSLVLADVKTYADDMPFGSKPVSGDKGMTLLAVFQAEASKLPMRLLSLSNDQASVAVRIDQQKNLTAEFKQGSTSAKITTKDVNATVAGILTVSWNANGSLELRARDADGKSFAGQAKLAAPSAPLKSLTIGRVNESDGKTLVSSGEQFQGWLAELIVYASALKVDQAQLLEGRLKEYYLQAAPPTPLKDRLKSKLSWVEPRKAWKVTASLKAGDAARAVDDNQTTRWATGAAMRGDEWFSIELPAETDIAGLALDSQGNQQDYPRKFKVELSMDGKAWGQAAQGDGKSALVEVLFPAPQRARFVRISQLGSAGNNWGFQEIVLLKP